MSKQHDSVFSPQLPLEVNLDDEPTFANYYLGESSENKQAVIQLVEFVQGRGIENFVFLWGYESVGLTHLLQASQHLAEALGNRAVYISLHDHKKHTPESLLAISEKCEFLCLDDFDVIAGNAEWERAVFHLYNRMRDAGHRILIAAHEPLQSMKVSLPDLKSRLSYGVTYQIKPLSDDEKVHALQLHANELGLSLNEETAWFIVHRASRGLSELFEILNKLDRASLAEKRKITIPFVKQVMEF
ncbi:DnaA regulatory inactivator Hda [Sessilibacter sp. MAH2]